MFGLHPKFLLITALMTVFLTGCGLSLAEDVTPPPGYRPPEQVQEELTTPQPVSASTVFPIVPPDPSTGASIYEEKCLACHGENGMGDGPQAENLPNPAPAIGSPEVARKSRPVEWFSIVTNGNLERFMPGFSGSLNDRQRWDVVAYVYSLNWTAGSLEQGKTAYEDNCVSCHGADGLGDGPEAASLDVKPASWNDTSRLADLSADDLVATISGERGDHPAVADELDAAQRYLVADYVRYLSFARESGPTASNEENAVNEDEPAVDEPDETEALRTISITGKVTNATPGGSIPEDLRVNLAAFQGMAPAFEAEVPAKEDGSYAFEEIGFNEELVYFVQVEANGLTFNSEILHGRDIAGDVVELPIEIYDTTSDTSFLKADRLHVFFDFSNPGVVQVVELFIISNPSDKVVVAGAEEQPVLTFEVPAEAQNLQFENGQMGERFVETANGFGDRMTIAPGMGQHQILFAYEMPYTRELDLNLKPPVPVDAAVVMIPPVGVTLKSAQLQSAGPYNMQGMSFEMFQAVNRIGAGEALQVNLSGKANAGGAAGVQEPDEMTGLYFGAAAFGLALIGAGLWLYKQQRSRQLAGANGEIFEENLPSETSEAVLDEIVALDDLHTSGGLPEAVYQERRAVLKTRLAEALDREKGE